MKEVVEELRDEVQASAPEGMQTFVTGPAGLTADLVSAFAGIDGILLLVALGAVFVILLIVYRSLLLPIAVLFTSVFALCAAILLVFGMAKLGWIQLNGQSQGILSILVIGAATDYALLYVARFREALTHTTNRTAAALTAWKNSWEPIVASGATVIIALLCLLFSDLNSNKALGPVAAAGILCSLFAALTLLPALMALLGRAAFWPFRPKLLPETEREPELVTGLEGPEGPVARHRFPRFPPAPRPSGSPPCCCSWWPRPASCSSRPTASRRPTSSSPPPTPSTARTPWPGTSTPAPAAPP